MLLNNPVKFVEFPAGELLRGLEQLARVLMCLLSMIVAISVWNNRVAPLFDVADEVELLELNQNVPTRIGPRHFESQGDKWAQLQAWGVELVVCGAICRYLQACGEQRGLSVVGFRSGSLSEVQQALMQGTLESDAMSLPGCQRRRSRLAKNSKRSAGRGDPQRSA